MNKIFKVIWSKSKQCYIVVSEIAKNKTGKKKIVVAGIFAALSLIGHLQPVQAIDGAGDKAGFSNAASGVNFDSTKGIAIGLKNGDKTSANGNVATVAIGAHSNAIGSSSVAIGGAVVNGAGAIGLGWSTANGDNSVALGGTGSTIANGNNAFAASGGNANGESATAIGSSAIADGRGGVAVGWNAESKVNAVGIGFNAKAKANNTIAIGVEANNDKANAISNNYSSVSIGVATRARAVGSMAMGVSADASGKYSIALGSGNVSGDYTATANYPIATGEKAIAIGYNSNSSNTGATAIGAGATATGQDSFAGGSGTAGGDSSIAIGKGVSITTPTAGTTVGGQDSIAMGTGASANQHSSVTIGAGSTSDGVRNITIGPKASASGVDSIAIGNGGVGGDKNNTGVGGNGNTYTIDVNGISTNVYYGVKSVDNGSIAFGNRANAAKGGLAIGTVSIADGGIAVGQSVLSKNGVAIGSAVSATAANAVAMGSTAEASSVGAVAIGGYSSATDKTKAQGNNALAIGASAVTNGNETIAIGKSANASNANAVAVGKNAKASIANSVAIGSDSTTDTNATRQANTTINGITYNFAGATSDTGMQVSVGAAGKERQIKNVAAGEVSATSTDAINGSQLFAVASQIKPINYVSIKSSAVGNKNNDGATGTDAVAIGPGAQSSGNNGVSLGNGSQANAESVVSIGYQSNYGAQNNPKSIGIGWAAGFQSNGTENIGIGTDAGRKLTGSNNVSIGKSAGLGDVYSSGSVLLGQSATIVNSTDKAAINDVVAIGNGAQGGAASSVAIGKGAKALGFSTIAIGENSNAKVKIGSAPSVAIGRNTTANGDYAVALGGGDNSGQFQGAKAAGVGTTAIGSATVTKDDTNFQTAVGFGAKTDATNASAFGYNASATANNATALGYAASATAENATALGTGAIAKIKDGVAIGSGSKATVDKGVKGYDPNDGRTNKYGGLTNNILTSTNAAVSVGEGASVTRQITGVAAGTSNTDAVNVAQLKSVNLAFSGNSGNNDVNLANGTLAIKGDTTYITTTANTNGITIAGKKQDISVNTNGVASANKGMADAQNVAQSINDAISKNAYTWTVSANGDAGESVAKGNKVDFNGDSSNITVERAGKKITTKLNKDITVDSVKANNKVTVGTAAKQLVLDGTTGAMTAGIGANAIKLDGTSATITAGSGNNAISLNGTNAQAAFGSGTNAVSINGKTGAVTGQIFTAGNTIINTTGLTSSTGSRTVSFGTNGISAGDQVISNVRTGGNTNSNAANIGDVKRYVSGATLNLTDGANHKGSVQLGDQSLKVSSGTGINATVSGQTVNIGLTTDAQNAISNGIGLLGNVGNTGIKQLKDGNATFDIKGDGSVVKTTASNSGVTIAVDTDKLAANTNLAYTANGASTAKNVALSKGLNFVNGSNTIAIVNDDGKVSFDLNAATKTQINTNTTGVAANKTNIATNAADIATNKNKIATNTTDIAANKSKIATNTTNIAANTTALARSISLGADSGAKSSQSLSTGDVAFNIKGATGDYISTKMNGNTVEVSTKRSTINSDANSGVASVTGDDGLATAKNVADAINNAVTKSAYEWKLSANSEANPTTVSKGDIVDFTGGSNITVERDNKNISVKLNKNLTNLSSVSIGNNKGETIKLDGSNGGITADHADFKDNTGAGTSIDTSGIRINNGITDLTQIGMGTISLDNGSGGNTIVTTSGVTLTDGSNMSEYNAKGIAFGDATGTNTAQFGLEGISAANQQIKDVATGTADTDAVNVKQLKDTVGDQKLNISDGTKDSSVALKNQKLTLTGTGAAKATVNGQTITIDVAEGTLTPNITNGTVTGTTGVAKATEVAAAINNTNTVLGDKIATNTTNIAHTIALADDAGTSTTAKSLKDGNVSFNIKGDSKFISTAASGNDVTLTVNEQSIKDAAKSASSFKVKANAHAEEEVKGGDTITFNNGDNIEISQAGKTFTIKTAKNMTVDSLTAGYTVINTTGLTSGTGASAVSFGTNGISAGNQVISNVASGNVNNNATDDSNAANIGDVKQAVANLSQNLNITDGTNNGTVNLKNQKLNVAGANGVTATVNNQTITVGLDADTVNATTKGIGLTADTGSTGNKYLKDGDVSFAVTGDGSLVSTSATSAGVKVAVNSASITAGTDGTITGPTTDGVATAKNVADAINAAKKASKTEITANTGEAANATTGNVTLTSTTAADGHTIYDVKLNDKVTLGSGANAVTIDGTIGAITGKMATIGGVTVNGTANTIGGLSNTTWNGTAVSGRAATEDQLKAATGATTLKFTGDVATNTGSVNLKDDTFGIKGDGKYISTDVNGKNVNLTVSEAEVKKSAVAAVTVSTDTTDANNPLTVTPTTSADGTTKDYKVTIDGTKIANKTNLSYKANDGTAKQVSLADGLNFKNGTLTTASIDDAGVVKYDVNTAAITASADGTITGPTTDGVATAQNVADAINAAKKASKTEITANTGEAANATTGNVTLTSTTAADGHTIYDVKLNDKVTLGTGANAVTVDGTTGAITGKTAIIGGVTVNGTANTIGGLSNTTWNGTATTGRAATEDQLKAVADAAGSQTWEITADKKAGTSGAQTGTKENAKVGKDDKVSLIAGENLTVDQAGKNFTYSLNADLVKMNSATFEATGGKTTVIKGDSIVQTDGANVNTSNATSNTITNGTNTSTITAGKAQFGTVGIDGVVSKISTGGTNAVVVNGADGTVKTGTVTVTGGTTNDITGLSNTTLSATDFATKGRAATEEQLKAATGATTLKFTGDVATNTGSVNLKDDTFGIKGDGKYISTDVNGKNVNLTVSEAEVKKSAVAAVTVSTDTTDANNPLTVTPTTSADGTTKDYKVTIDGTKIANKTNLSYKANDGTAKQVSLADGLNFKNGTLTTASIDDAGVVKYDVNTAAITAGADGTITGPTTDGVATAKNVADAINAAKKASKTEITANTGEAANATTGNVTLTSTTAADGQTIYDVKLNDKVTLGTGANAVTVDGTTGAITGKTANIGGVTVNGTANTIGGLSNTTWNGTATTGRAATEDQLKAVADAAGSQTWNITADKAGTTGNQTGTKKNATVGKDETVELVAGDNLTINQDERKFTYSLNKDLAGLTSVSIGTGTTETIKLDGATGKITAKNAAIGGVTIDGDNKHVTGLSNTTWNGTATTGRAATEDQLKAVAETAKTTTDAVNLKFSGDTNTSPGVVNLKDDTLGIVGDGKYVSTDANGKNLTVKVSEAEVKKSAVAAVTVSTDTTDANNPISVTPTTSADGTTKDYKVTIDGTKIANKTNLSYKANDGTAKQVSLADGLNFKNGTLTTASIDDAGVVKYDVNTAAITASADGTITGPTTDGVATAQNVADAINAAKKASKTEITANTGEAANATTGNVTLTSTTAADGHTIYDVKLNDKVTLGSGANAVTIDGTAGKATIGSSVINGVNNTFTTGGAKAVTLDGATGTITGTTANIGGVTVNGTANTIGGLSNTTWNGTATTGRAATEDQLKAVADAAGSQTWEITADKKAGTSGAQTGTKENAKVGKDDKVSLIAGENLTVDQAGKNFTYSLNTDLVKMNSATFLGTGTNTTVITGDSITQTAGTQTNTSTAAGNTVANGTKSTETTADGQVIKDGTKINTSTVDENTIVDGARSNKTTVDSNVIDDGNGNVNISNATSNTITDGTNTSTITAGKATIGSSVIDGVNNTFTTGGANAVKLDGAAGTIKTGTVTVTGGTTNDITGLSNTTLSATDFATKGRAATEEQLKAATGATTLKFTGDVATNTGSVNLKDDTFGIKGDGKYISTDVNGKNVNLTVSEAEVKKSAVAAVTVSTDTTDANNPISVTPTTSADGTTKDYKVTIDGTKIANKTNLSYKANDGTAKQVSLADGLNFKNGTLTTASIDDAGVVKYDVNTAAITASADGTITGPTTDGVATAQNVADAINAAKKASKTEITANTGEAANATTGNVTLTSTTAADGHTIYDVKLNDKVTLGTGANVVTIDGTAGKATIGSSIVDGVNNTFTTGGASPVTLNGATGTITGKTANIGGVTVDGTNNHVMGLANKDWTPGVTQAVSGRAATEDQLQKVSDAVGAGWKVNTGKVTGSTGESNGAASTKVASGEEVQFQAGNNLIVDQNGKTVAYSLNKALKDLESATFNGTGTNKTVITGDSITQTAGTQTNTSTAGGNIVADGANSTAITAAGTTVTTANGNTNYAADGVRINTTGKTPVSLTDAGLDNGNNVIKNVASGHVNNDATDNTNAANIADVKKATTTVTANAGEAANATTGNVTLTSTTAVDGHTIYDVKLNDKVTLGTGANAVTIDGTAGKATVGSSVIDGVNNTFTTGGANAVKLDGAAGTIKTGTVTVTGGTTNDITGLSNTTVTAADFATKGRAATEEQLKAVGEQTWQITADKDAATSGAQTGTKKDAKVGKDDKVQLIAGENLTVNQNERDFTYSLNKDLVKMNSATFEATGGKTTVIKGDSIVQTDGTKVNTSTAGGNTVVDGTKSTATTADGTTVTSANGNTKYAADGVRINTTGKNPVSLTDAGLDNGNNVIKNVASGHVNNDATDNTNAANIADVKKATTTVTANAGEAANATKGNVTLTSTTAADGHTIYDVKLNDKVTLGTGANAVTIDGTAGKATVGASVIDGVNNTFTTGGANAVKLDGAAGTIKTGTVTVTGGTTNDITGLSNTTVTSADFATKGRAATEEQLKAVGEQTWQITADKDATTSGAQTGTKKDAKVGKDDKVQLIAGENMTVNQNERDFTFTLNKDLVKMNSATFLGTGSNTTVITGNSITQTAGTQTNTSTAAGNTIANGTKSTETTADGQVIKDGAKSNKSTVDNNVIDDGNGNVNTSNATSNTITDGTNTTATTSSSVTVKDNAGNSTVITKDNITTGVGGNKITLDGTAGKATVGASVVDGVNNTFTTGGANAVKLDGVAGTIKTGTVTVTGGTTNDITGLSNTTVTAADFATKGRAATEEQLKAVGEQTWQITADKDATTSGAQTGTKKDAKVGKDDKVQLIAGENMTVNQNERDFTFTLNKDLVKMNSATFLGTGSNTTVITGNSITQTAGTQTNTSTAAGNTIANGTKSTETTADGQVIKDGAKSNKSTVDSNVIDDGNGNVNTSNATSNTITDGTNTSTITAGKANIGNIVVDGVNNKITVGTGANPVTLDGANGHLDGLTNTTWVPGVTKATTGRAATEDQLQQVSDAVGAGWKVNTGTVAGSSGVSNGAASTKVSSGEEVKLQAGDNLVIDQNGKTVSYSLNKDLTKMNSATFEATGGKTTVIKGDSIVQTDGGKTNTSNAAGNTVVDGNKSTAITAAGTTITDGAKTNTSTADKNVINDGAGNTNVSNATSNTLKNAAGDETKSDAKGVTVKDAAGNNATFTKDGITITKTGKDTVSLTSNGLDNGKNKIVNVAAGTADTDAVNVSQLKEYAAKSTTELTANGGQPAGSTTGNIVLTKTTAADGHTIYDNKLNDKITLGTDPTKAVTVDGTTGTVTGLTNKTWTPGSIVSGRAATEDQLKDAVADSGWKAAVDKEGSGQSTVVGTSPEKIKAEETVTFKAGNNMMVTQTGKSISYAVNPELTNMASATFKDAAGNTTVTNGNGITITPGSANPTNPHAGPVSLTKDGLNNGNNQIKGVAPGTDPTDAVNVSQLNASNANTSQAINQIAGEVQHVGAHAAAMAALKPIQYDPLEPTQVMAGVGNYRGETAAALGLAHYTNENTMFNVGVSVGGNHNMVNAGVTHKFGYSPEKKNIPDRYKAGPISSVYVMQDEVSSLKKENAEQKYVIADQAARLTTLEAENEQQRRELAETKKGLDDLKAAVDKLLASKG